MARTKTTKATETTEATTTATDEPRFPEAYVGQIVHVYDEAAFGDLNPRAAIVRGIHNGAEPDPNDPNKVSLAVFADSVTDSPTKFNAYERVELINPDDEPRPGVGVWAKPVCPQCRSAPPTE